MKDFLMCQQLSKSQILLLTKRLRFEKIVVEKLDILVSLPTGSRDFSFIKLLWPIIVLIVFRAKNYVILILRINYWLL